MQTYKIPYFQAWYQVSPLYYEYGKAVILNNPIIYIQHFVLPNIRYFFIPRRYEMEKYSYDEVKTVPIDTKEWFAYKSDVLKSNYPKIQSFISAAFSPFYVLVMIASLVSPFFFYKIIFKKQEDVKIKNFRNLLLFWISFYIINMGFNVLAGPIVLRYQMAIYIIGAVISLYFIDKVILFKWNANIVKM